MKHAEFPEKKKKKKNIGLEVSILQLEAVGRRALVFPSSPVILSRQ